MAERDAEKLLRERREKLASMVDEVLRTESGKALFAHLALYCGFTSTSLTADRNTGGVDLVTSGLNEARRGVYLHLRDLAAPSLLQSAEALAEQQRRAEAFKKPEEKK